MQCYACELEAVQECPRCGALYCDDHGAALCERCMDPALALPSYRVYRGSLLALLIGTLVAVWLLVRPAPAIDADSALPNTFGVAFTGAPTAPAGDTAAAGATAEATVTTTPAPTPTATPTAAPTATSTPVPQGEQEYVVGAGDSLYSIAEQVLPPDADQTTILEFAEEIAAYNDITDASSILIGQVIKVPAQ